MKQAREHKAELLIDRNERANKKQAGRQVNKHARVPITCFIDVVVIGAGCGERCHRWGRNVLFDYSIRRFVEGE